MDDNEQDEQNPLVRSNGEKRWLKNGVLHREDGPAIECEDGSEFWYVNGKCHKDDGPAVVIKDKLKTWWKNGRRHREDGPAVELNNGAISWYLDSVHYKNIDDYFVALEKIKGKTYANKLKMMYI